MIEQLISSDLAALAAHDRQNIGALVLPEPTDKARARFVVPWPAVVSGAAVATSCVVGARMLLPSLYEDAIWQTRGLADPWLVGSITIALTALAYLVATRLTVRGDRVAAFSSATGAAWGGSVAALLCAVVCWVAIQNPGDTFIAHDWQSHRFMPPYMIGSFLVAVVSCASAVGSTWRGRVGARSATWLAIVQLLGGASILVIFGMMLFASNYWGWRELFSPYHVGNSDELVWNPQIVVARWAVGGSLVGVVGCAVAIALACMRERTNERARLLALLEHRSIAPIALTVGIATMTLDSVLLKNNQALHLGQQIILASLGTLSVTLLVATWSLRQRRRALTQVSAAAPRGATHSRRWLPETTPIILAFVAASVLIEADLQTFDSTPQLAVALVLSVMAMLGLAGSRPVRSGRPLGEVLAAGLLTATAATSVAIGWSQHTTGCLFFDAHGATVGACQANPTVTTTAFAMLSWATALVVTAIVARMIRREGPRAWTVAAKVIVVTVLLTWLGLDQYQDRWVEVIRFHHEPAPLAIQLGGLIRMAQYHVLYGCSYLDIEASPTQLHAVWSGVLLFGLAVSIGIACTRERKRPSRWLALLEFPLVIPLGVVFATASLVLASTHLDRDEAGQYAAWASNGAVVAYASMLLRRRRREALS